jgi:hypothetical protein
MPILRIIAIVLIVLVLLSLTIGLPGIPNPKKITEIILLSLAIVCLALTSTVTS